MASPYLQPVAPAWGRIAGIILLVAALGLTALLLYQLWVLAVDAEARAQARSSTLIFGLILVALCGCCWQAGYRLALNRPGPNGSLFSRSGWAAIGSGLCGMAALMAYAIISARAVGWNDFYVVTGLGAFGIWCFVLAWRG